MIRLVGCGPAAYPCQKRACWFLLMDEAVPAQGGTPMNNIPVAGVDVSKRFSDLCVLTPENEVFTRTKIYHDLTSMERALDLLLQAEQQFGMRPVVVMESTSHYHLILFRFFKNAGYEVIVVNPIQSGALKNINVRKVKNDKVDAHKIALLYRLKVLRPSQVPADSLRGLRLLCRQRSEVMKNITRFKNHLTALLDQIFPGYDKVFADVGGVSSLAVLDAYPTPQLLLSASPETLVEIIRKVSYAGAAFGKKKADLLFSAAADACTLGLTSPGDEAVIRTAVSILKVLTENKARLEHEIRVLILREKYIRDNLALLQSIPGIGPHSAAVILAEIGDFSLFRKPKELAAYFGLDPGERQSGTFRGSKNRMSKRGSHHVRAMLHMAAHNCVHSKGKKPPSNPVLAEFYDKKCYSKPPLVAMCAVMHKISNIIFAVLRDQKPFELRFPQDHAQRLGMSIAA